MLDLGVSARGVRDCSLFGQRSANTDQHLRSGIPMADGHKVIHRGGEQRCRSVPGLVTPQRLGFENLSFGGIRSAIIASKGRRCAVCGGVDGWNPRPSPDRPACFAPRAPASSVGLAIRAAKRLGDGPSIGTRPKARGIHDDSLHPELPAGTQKSDVQDGRPPLTWPD